MTSKIGYLACLWYHCLATMSAYIYVVLFESGTETGLWTIVLHRKDIALLCKQKE